VLSELLMEMGAMSVVVEDAELAGAEAKRHWGAVGWGFGEVANMPGARRESGSLQSCTIAAYFSEGHDIASTVDLLFSTMQLPDTPRYSIENVGNWEEATQEAWPPVILGDLTLRYPWHSDAEVEAFLRTEGIGSGATPYSLILQAGAAWGSGEHSTTQLCCAWLRETLAGGQGGLRCLDYGAGSGVLGMAAALYGAQEVVGVEIDAAAIDVAHANAAINGIDFKCYLPSEYFGQDFDIVVANILAQPLMQLSTELAGAVRPGGRLALCGIRQYQAEEIVATYSALLADVHVEAEDRGWVLITGKKRAS